MAEKTGKIILKNGDDMMGKIFTIMHAALTEESIAGLKHHLATEVDATEMALLTKLSNKLGVTQEVAKAGDSIMRTIVKSFVAAHAPPEIAMLVAAIVEGAEVKIGGPEDAAKFIASQMGEKKTGISDPFGVHKPEVKMVH